MFYQNKKNQNDKISTTSSKDTISFLNIIPNELWLEIFSHLSPVDLCFSISTVCKLFYELSSDNVIWSKFKAENWTLESLKEVPMKKKSYIDKKSIEKPNIFKAIYLQWIQEQVTGLKGYITLNKNSDTNNTKPVPVFKPKVPFRNSLTWLQHGKRHFQLAIACKLDLKDLKLGPLIIKNKNLETLILQQNKDVLYNLSNLFNSDKMEVTLQEHNLYYTRWGAIRGIDNMVGYFDGIFWCVTNEKEKNFIDYAKKRSKYIHLIVIDATSLTNDPALPSDFKDWAKENNIDFIEYNALDTALNKMLNILNSKFEGRYPKYLPTRNEFSKFAFNGQPLGDIVDDNFLYWF